MKKFLLIFMAFFTLQGCYSLFLNVVDSPLDEKWIRKDIIYQKERLSDRKKQSLDLYIPPNRLNFPVLLFVHGGGWVSGDKSEWKFLGKFFANNGICTAIINYRLSPKVKHPAHIEDVASSFAWIYKNIKKFCGNPQNIFIMGHSAGAHLSALLALEGKYLNAYGLSTDLIKGVIVIDGIYDLTFQGKKDTLFTKAFFNPVFGKGLKIRKKASPIFYVKKESPPFLIIHAEKDHLVPLSQPLKFYRALKNKGANVELAIIPLKNHITIMTSIGKPGDLTTEKIFSFIKKNK